MISLTDICDAVWTAGTRTLHVGAFGAPANLLEAICKACWEYETRELTSAPPDTSGRRPWWLFRQREIIQ